MKLSQSIKTGTAIAMLALLTACATSNSGIAIDATGNLYVAYHGNGESGIRKITPAGETSILAGGKKGFHDGQGSLAKFGGVLVGITIDAAGNLYVTDYHNYRIRKITPRGEVSTLAGSGNKGLRDGQGSVAEFRYLEGIAVDAAGNLYVADDDSIRKVTSEGKVSTLVRGRGVDPSTVIEFLAVTGLLVSGQGHRAADVSDVISASDGRGHGVRFTSPHSIAVDAAGNLYVTAGAYSFYIFKITPKGEKGEISILAGGEQPGFVDGQGYYARFNNPRGIAIDKAGNLYVTDRGNNSIRMVTPEGEVSTLANRFRKPSRIAIDAESNLYVTTDSSERIHKIEFHHP
jgi:DNA-binding beta-propeller fold protein YncE